MTQITKTLSIAGIIALVTAPAMAEIASTAYVQNIVNNIPTPAAATASTAGLTKLYSDVGTNTDGAMTQKAITDALDRKMTDPGGDGESIEGEGLFLTYVYDDTLEDYTLGWVDPLIALPNNLLYGGSDADTLVIGAGASVGEGDTVAIGPGAIAEWEGGHAIGYNAKTTATYSIQLGPGTNNTANTFSVGLGREANRNYQLLDSNGKIPADRISLDSILPTPPEGCATQKCALVRDASTNPATYTWEVIKVNQ